MTTTVRSSLTQNSCELGKLLIERPDGHEVCM